MMYKLAIALLLVSLSLADGRYIGGDGAIGGFGGHSTSVVQQQKHHMPMVPVVKKLVGIGGYGNGGGYRSYGLGGGYGIGGGYGSYGMDGGGGYGIGAGGFGGIARQEIFLNGNI